MTDSPPPCTIKWSLASTPLDKGRYSRAAIRARAEAALPMDLYEAGKALGMAHMDRAALLAEVERLREIVRMGMREADARYEEARHGR